MIEWYLVIRTRWHYKIRERCFDFFSSKIQDLKLKISMNASRLQQKIYLYHPHHMDSLDSLLLSVPICYHSWYVP